ncbi:MAG: (Fe-S)-binding protein, partial [Dethiobacter sp.]|nr:(Fe-S)-binding protein [Dethiobacter sp.]
ESGMVQPTVRDALESVFQEGNPWKKPRATRLDWAEGLEVKIAKPGEKVENLIFICCTVAYDPKLQDIARNLVKVLNKAEVDYGLVGDGEMCCSSEVYSLGEAGLFEMMVEDNTELLNSFAVNRIVTISPHCYSTFKNQHPLLKMESVHYTHLLCKLLAEGKLELTKEVSRKVVFHDPCYLGKKNSVFEEPRFILKQVPGMEILEFARKRERSLCCEGGGGKKWVETESLKERLAENRIKDARALGADVLAVACPFCILTLDDALKAKGLEEEMKVVDILEILNEAAG